MLPVVYPIVVGFSLDVRQHSAQSYRSFITVLDQLCAESPHPGCLLLLRAQGLFSSRCATPFIVQTRTGQERCTRGVVGGGISLGGITAVYPWVGNRLYS